MLLQKATQIAAASWQYLKNSHPVCNEADAALYLVEKVEAAHIRQVSEVAN